MVAAALGASWTLLIVFAAQTLSWAGLPAIGTAALGAAGVLASQGTLRLWPLLIAGIAGAQCGGIIGWKLGRDVAAREANRQHKDTRLAERSREAVRAGRELEQRYGGVMVLFVSSWISGSLGLQFRRFFVWNMIAATLWTVASVVGAYGIGTAVSDGSATDDPLAVIIAAAAVALLALAFLRRRRNRRAAQATTRPA
jgi:MYXO-CTERM domain-containing protein